MIQRFVRWLPAVCIIMLLIAHALLWRWLMTHDAAASLFSSGPEHSAAIFIAMLVFMAARMILYLIVPGYVAAWLLRRLLFSNSLLSRSVARPTPEKPS